MAKHKTKIITAAIIVAVLSAAWLWGGNFNKTDSADGAAGSVSTAEGTRPQAASETTAAAPSGQGASALDAATTAAAPGGQKTATSDGWDTVGPNATAATSEPRSGELGSPDGATTMAMPDGGKMSAADGQGATATGATPPRSSPKDQYLTEPPPSGKPAPVEPQDAAAGDGSFTVTLSVRCDMVLNNMNLLDKEKHELVPADGIIFPATEVTAHEGESVFNVLQREMKRAKIHMTFRSTQIYNSAYIEDINNIYEFDAGELSGWLYAVNGWYPNYGCSRYQLKAGDVIEWNYSCDLGRDLGQDGIGGGQKE